MNNQSKHAIVWNTTTMLILALVLLLIILVILGYVSSSGMTTFAFLEEILG
jgi:hypothetical protein